MDVQRGLTLPELIVSLTIVFILASAGVPSLQGFVLDNRLISRVHILMGTLSQSRSESIKRGARVTVCRSSDGAFCGGDWSHGWVAFQDTDRNGERDEDEPLLLSHQQAQGGISIEWNNPSNPEISFLPSGIANYDAGMFTFCDSRGSEHARAIIVSPVGRARISRENSGGDPLEC